MRVNDKTKIERTAKTKSLASVEEALWNKKYETIDLDHQWSLIIGSELERERGEGQKSERERKTGMWGVGERYIEIVKGRTEKERDSVSEKEKKT